MHGNAETPWEEANDELRRLIDARGAFRDCGQALDARQLGPRGSRREHFGFRDGISNPGIVLDGEPEPRRRLQHRPGELLLGHPNNLGFDPWKDSGSAVPEATQRFLRNGSFGVLRKIEQKVKDFERYLEEQALRLQPGYPLISVSYLKAKICGRWPDGQVLRPEHGFVPPGAAEPVDNDFDFTADPRGEGCPFGAHIRRTNPRADTLAPARLRPLFRRGMPYGQAADAERGLMGLFFCASIEDQFETVMSEWVEKMPMGPRSLGNAKDPLIGEHDDAASRFQIPLPGRAPIELSGFAPFTRTRGMLYAWFPGREALHEMAGWGRVAATAAPPARARSSAPAAQQPAAPDGAPAAGDAAVEAPADRFCDIVMEGGITSGIIYTTAVAALARHYRFQSIGGSSIGAFAAALTAAAEFQRRKGSMAGFEAIAQLPEKLAKVDDEDRTQLFRLFRPQAQTQRLFRVFQAALARKSARSSVWHGLREALRQYAPQLHQVVLLGLLLVLGGPFALTWLNLTSSRAAGAAGWWLALAAWLPAALLSLTLLAALTLAWCIGRDFWRHVVPNGFGLCRGWTHGDTLDAPDLAGFMHLAIQATAGRSPTDPAPLCFQDLWDAPGSPAAMFGGGATQRSIDMQVYSTHLNHGRPYRFPLDESQDSGHLYFCVKDLQDYFPAQVIQHLRLNSTAYEQQDAERDPAPPQCELRKLPEGKLPIVVAARMAMSFPGLISAVPVWSIDREGAKPVFARCWLSDGGLCTNFPIHLFDSFVPAWPTFGISLLTSDARHPDRAPWLPGTECEGSADIWDRGTADERPARARLVAFLFGLWRATWRWNDMNAMRMPGVRDRVVRVYLGPDEGGVNIKMPPGDIMRLANDYGRAAAQAFIDKFAQPDSRGWEEHRWVRLNRLLIALRDQIGGFASAAGLRRYARPLDECVQAAVRDAPLRGGDAGPQKLSAQQADELQQLLAALRALEQAFEAAGDHQPYRSFPRPALRVRHPG
jgi:deferrochelatase/peroxidase EfeB/predicted acylesterase/phospholipase RssA